MRGLYAIVDRSYIAADELTQRCQETLEAGCRMIQYRDKTASAAEREGRARQLQQVCTAYGADFILNDDLALAARLNCGVHLGADDANIAEARQILGGDQLIGASCYNRLALAEQAAADGASYIAFGAFFNSDTKPNAVVASIELLQQAQALNVATVAIGGITPDNGAALVTAGADMLAVISGLWQADNLSQQIQRYQQLFN